MLNPRMSPRRRLVQCQLPCIGGLMRCGRSLHLVEEAREQPLRRVGMGDAAPPARHHLVVGLRKRTFDSRAGSWSSRPRCSSRSQSGVLGSACSRLIVRTGTFDASMNSLQASLVRATVRVEPEDDARRHLHPVAVERLDRLEDRQRRCGLLSMLFERLRLPASRCRRRR